VRLHPRPLRSAAALLGRGAACAWAGIALVSAQSLDFKDNPADSEDLESGGLLNADLMPDGGILKNVLIPQYDRNLVLTATLRAGEMEIFVEKAEEGVQIKRIDALRVNLDFLNPDRSPKGAIAMSKARYDAKKQLLTSDEPVSLVSDDLTAEGSSLVYDLENTRGFLRGPVTATTLIDQRTSMNTKPVRQAIAAGTVMMATAINLPAQEALPAATVAERIAEARLSPEELARLSKDSETARPRVKAATDQGDAELEEATRRSEQATATMADFFRVAAMTTLLAEPLSPATDTNNDVPRPNIPADPNKTRITSDDGAFFDSKNGLLIFLKNVVVRDPRFSLTGADEVKVFFDSQQETVAARAKVMAEMKDRAKAKADAKAKAEGKDPEASDTETPAGETETPAAEGKPEPANKEKAGLTDAKFGDPNKIIATGTVVVEYQSEKKDDPPVKASARTVIYDLKKEEFILRGGSPWILRDGQVSSVPGNDAYIVIQKDGSFVTGNGGIDAQMDIQDKKKEDKKNR
jgi:lipopolysaccharide export system protein LptA